MKKTLSSKKICEGLPPEFATFLSYCRQLSFEQKPDYGMLTQLLESIAIRKNIDLSTDLFDWKVMAAVINYHPELYDFIANQYFQPREEDFPFKEDGYLDPSRIVDKNLERKVYEKALQFQFSHPHQTGKLLAKAQIRKYEQMAIGLDVDQHIEQQREKNHEFRNYRRNIAEKRLEDFKKYIKD